MEFRICSKLEGGRVQKRCSNPCEVCKSGENKIQDAKSAGEALVKQNLSNCFYEKSTTSEDGNTEDDSDYIGDSCNEKEKKNLPCGSKQSETKGVEVERRLFICESTQLMDLIHQINSSSKCLTPDCNGK